jgi:hypothetical protein
VSDDDAMSVVNNKRNGMNQRDVLLAKKVNLDKVHVSTRTHDVTGLSDSHCIPLEHWAFSELDSITIHKTVLLKCYYRSSKK